MKIKKKYLLIFCLFVSSIYNLPKAENYTSKPADIRQLNELFYTVQIGVYKQPIKPHPFFSTYPFYSESIIKLAVVAVSTALVETFILAVMPMRIIVISSAISLLISLLVIFF